MSESIRSPYQCLFEVRLLHHFWLDDGATIYDQMTDLDKKNRRLQSYDSRTFLNVIPTRPTAQAIQGLNGIFKNTRSGFIVAVPQNRTIPNDLSCEFVVSVLDPQFFNYTALTLPKQQVVEIYHKPEDKTYHYKSNVFVLSNQTGVSRGSAGDKSLFLSSRYAARSANDKIEALVTSGNTLSQLSSDNPNPTLQRINARATALPAFMHQGDIPLITPPAGLSGAPDRGILLTPGIPEAVFALLRLSPIRNDDADFSFSAGGLAKTPHPVFQVRFKNRSTIRRYLHKPNGSIDATEINTTPLTYYGNAGNRHKPSLTGIKMETSGGRINRLISDIFV